jgi:hypothetical protein
MMDTVNYQNSSGTVWEYRRIVASGDTIKTGTSSATAAKQGMFNGAAIYYFGFGLDAFGTVDNKVYVISGGPTIMLNTNSHIVKRYNIVPPGGAQTTGYARFSDIPNDWLSNPNITTQDSGLHEYGFYSTAGTPEPVAAAGALIPSAFALLLAAIIALMF